jgi:hypothetical protein
MLCHLAEQALVQAQPVPMAGSLALQGQNPSLSMSAVSRAVASAAAGRC